MNIGRRLCGEAIPYSKLTEAQVRLILQELANGRTSASVAREYGVSPVTVSDIRNRVTWRHVDHPAAALLVTKPSRSRRLSPRPSGARP